MKTSVKAAPLDLEAVPAVAAHAPSLQRLTWQLNANESRERTLNKQPQIC